MADHPPAATSVPGLELWGGHECTLSRVGDRWFDQTRLSGHHDRVSDLDLFAALGITALRYPVLWEQTAPDHPDERDFAWADARLERLRALDIRPIVGLIHHGSGPKYTHLLDDGFAPGLAVHAGAVAERFPWIRDYTPVNEPLTTARFAALYGVWYPHTCDEASCWRALLNQIDATRLAMRAIRRVNPAARLIATDDLGHAFGTPEAAVEVAFENERRWLGWDLLFGRVVPDHPLWQRLADHGLADRLRAIADDPCPPDIVGINHYVTSSRFLDHRLQPAEIPAADHTQLVASRDAIRRVPDRVPNIAVLLGEAWTRYGTTLAVTEAHLGCTREEQLRWFARVWDGAGSARAAGADVVAVTAWSLLGAHGWDALATGGGSYEPGVFDTRAPSPRPTALVPLLQALAAGATPPVSTLVAQPGWWERLRTDCPDRPAPPIMITGRTGTLGQALARACAARGLSHVLTSREDVALTDAASIDAALDRLQPAAVINTAGLVDIDRAEREPALAMAINADVPALLAAACRARGIAFVTLSSDQVFAGDKVGDYVESDATAPRNVYGRSKAAAEARVLDVMPAALVVRTAAFFSPHDRHNFAVHALDALGRGERFAAAGDGIVSPTYVPDLVDTLLDLLLDGAGGLWHVATPGRASWAGFARALAAAAGLDARLVDARPSATLGWTAPRPVAVALASERSWTMPPLESAVARLAAAYTQAHPRRTTSPAAQPAASASATATRP